MNNLSIKITDFGFACFFNPKEGLHDVLGSPLYMAPEIIKEKSYNSEVDIWSCGVITYILLSGRPPFRGREKKEIFHSIENSPLKFDHPIWDRLSREAKEFIKIALEKDFTKRANAFQLLNHEWIQKQVKNPQIEEGEMENIASNLKDFTVIIYFLTQ